MSLRGHSVSYILAAIESPCTILYRLLLLSVTFALSSTVSGILQVLYTQIQLRKRTGAEYVGLIEMHPATLHGVSVITKLYFVTCGNYGIDDFESRSEVIQGHGFWYQSKARMHVAIIGQ